MFFALARAIPFARAVIPVPSYIDYATAVQAAGREVRLLKLDEATDFAIDWRAVGSGASRRRDRAVWPAEQSHGPSVRVGRTSGAGRRGIPATTFVVDEAFADFIDGYQSLAERPAANVIVVRSLTKFYAIPGLRLGYAVASPRDGRANPRPDSALVGERLAQEAAVALLGR